MLRVFLPYTRLRDDVVGALREQTDSLELVDVSRRRTDYWAMLRDAWASGEAFAVVEHDVVIAPGTIAGFEACSEPLCGCVDPDSDPIMSGSPYLQCVRFSEELIGARPSHISQMPTYTRHWALLDHVIRARLGKRGYSEHIHTETPTRHMNTWPEEKLRRREASIMRFLVPFGPVAEIALNQLDILWRAGDLDRVDVEVFAQFLASSAVFSALGVEKMSDEEIREIDVDDLRRQGLLLT